MRRISTGVFGLDKLIQGGLPENSITLLTGSAGTGKTIFSCQFLWHGLQKGERGVYITLEEEPDDIKEDALQFGWDFESFEKKGLFKITYHDPAQISIASTIIDEVKRIEAKRLVIDSVSIMGLNMESPSKIRKLLLNIINTIKRVNCTAILTSEIEEGSNRLSRFGVEEFVADGVIKLQFIGIGAQSFGNLQIRKMRRTEHRKGWFPMEITPKGIEIGKEEVSVLLK
ncbi:MAG: hypothetical protein DRP13_02945 [Candidatus Aenigmatarchaeota archaeon]|mgnify:CR=1 FL=1|nr:MAG: hypothetical protein DRP13_02945 [Candidatus Aenigmarchaeota archaeon]